MMQEPLYEPNILCIFVLRITSGPRMKFVDSKGGLTPPPVLYAADRSKAVVLVLFLFCFTLFTTERFMFSLAFFFVLVFSVLLAL